MRPARSYTTRFGADGHPSADREASTRSALDTLFNAEGAENEREDAENKWERAYLTLAPGGTSASKVHSTALPSTDAASTMPFDSTPISFAGFRSATITTFFPTSVSGA